MAVGSSFSGYTATPGNVREPKDKEMASLGFQNHQGHSDQVILGGLSGGLDLAAMKNYLKFSMERKSQPRPRELFWDTLAGALCSCPNKLAATSEAWKALPSLVYGPASLRGWSVAGIGVYPGFSQPRLGGVGTGS